MLCKDRFKAKERREKWKFVSKNIPNANHVRTRIKSILILFRSTMMMAWAEAFMLRWSVCRVKMTDRIGKSSLSPDQPNYCCYSGYALALRRSITKTCQTCFRHSAYILMNRNWRKYSLDRHSIVDEVNYDYFESDGISKWRQIPRKAGPQSK